MTRRDWTILLIGGGSATGKSTLAKALAAHFDLQYIDADLFYMVLRRSVPPKDAPLRLQQLDEAYWAGPIRDLLHDQDEARDFVCRSLEVVVAQQYRAAKPSVLEGSWLSPSFARQRTYDGFDTGDSLRSIFLHEPDSARIEERRRRRANPWDRRFDPAVMRNIEDLRRCIGANLKQEAEALGLPVLRSRPFNSLLDRALSALRQQGQ